MKIKGENYILEHILYANKNTGCILYLPCEKDEGEDSFKPAMDISLDTKEDFLLENENKIVVKDWGENAEYIKPLLELDCFTDTGERVNIQGRSAPIWNWDQSLI